MGCGKKAVKDADFCAKDLKRIPEELKSERKLAMVHLAIQDGYLVRHEPKVRITDVPASAGRDYV